jgi:hypothetical protein
MFFYFHNNVYIYSTPPIKGCIIGQLRSTSTPVIVLYKMKTRSKIPNGRATREHQFFSMYLRGPKIPVTIYCNSPTGASFNHR